MKVAVFPGTFDPITNGHMDIINRASKLFDEVIVLVAINPIKKSVFTLEERVQEIKEATKKIPNVKVDFTRGLTVEYALKHNANCLIRGLRNKTDLQFETELMIVNKTIAPSIETLFLIADEELKGISSTRVKDLYKNGIDISNLVPKSVLDRMK